MALSYEKHLNLLHLAEADSVRTENADAWVGELAEAIRVLHVQADAVVRRLRAADLPVAPELEKFVRVLPAVAEAVRTPERKVVSAKPSAKGLMTVQDIMRLAGTR